MKFARFVKAIFAIFFFAVTLLQQTDGVSLFDAFLSQNILSFVRCIKFALLADCDIYFSHSMSEST